MPLTHARVASFRWMKTCFADLRTREDRSMTLQTSTTHCACQPSGPCETCSAVSVAPLISTAVTLLHVAEIPLVLSKEPTVLDLDLSRIREAAVVDATSNPMDQRPCSLVRQLAMPSV